jgi:hypothetical protein
VSSYAEKVILMDEILVGKKVSIDFGPSSAIIHVEIVEVNPVYLVAVDANNRLRYIPLTAVNMITLNKGQLSNDSN